MNSQQKRPGELLHPWKFAVEIQLMFFDVTISSKNYTICKIHVSDIFPTDWSRLSWEQSISHLHVYTMSDNGLRVIGDSKFHYKLSAYERV